MGWFAVGIDPLLRLLERKLQGILICSLQVLGPAEQDQPRLPKVEERYTVYGLADDVKANVSCMAEFAVIEEAAHLFELSSGNKLHRNPVNGKCKVFTTWEVAQHYSTRGYSSTTLQAIRHALHGGGGSHGQLAADKETQQ